MGLTVDVIVVALPVAWAVLSALKPEADAFNASLPMVRRAMGVLGLFTFIWYWNSFLWPLISINSRSRATVPLGLDYFLSEQGYIGNLLMAGGTISVVPGVILAVLLQRWLSQGTSLAGLGGR